MKISSPVVALFVGDIHLSMKPPIARAEEPSWFAAMERSLAELRDLAAKHEAIVLCAGDIFDKWNSPPELINWAIERLPPLLAIPGNHDLPNHRPELAYRSAYGTLVRAGRITELQGWPFYHKGLAIYGRPFGEEIPEVRRNPKIRQILVTHEYLWADRATGHVGASADSKLSRVAKNFAGFDVVISGDNHIGFERRLKSGTLIVNCGTFFRRKTTDRLFQPRIGLLHASGGVSFHPLEFREEKLSSLVTPEDERQNEEEVEGIASFVEALSSLESSSLDFRDNIMRTLEARKVREGVRSIILTAME